LKLIHSSGEVEQLAAQVSDNGGVYMVPAFSGLGAPYWNQEARGLIIGLTRGTTDAHVARAAVESIAFQTMDVLKAMEADAGIQIKEVRVDGGATVNNVLMQFQSDILHTQVIRPKITETTAMGAAYLAGLAVGFWKDTAELAQYWQQDRAFQPSMDAAAARELTTQWGRAIRAAQAYTQE
jgi:glycerol kinase